MASASINILVFDGFTTLDATGPAEVLARLGDERRIDYLSLNGGSVSGSAGAKIATRRIDEPCDSEILLVPGGLGTRTLVDDPRFIAELGALARRSEIVMCVCTGSALLAKTGLLKGKRATSNKRAWDWVLSQESGVIWVRKARWVVDGKYRSSSGVSAGIDMALGYVADTYGRETAISIARSMEHVWNEDAGDDSFC